MPVMRPCIECGDLVESPASRCELHKRKQSPRPSATQRGYPAWWQKLSADARQMQPWCEDCGSTEHLTVDHSPEAWAMVMQGKRLTIRHFQNGLLAVVCANCNRKRGSARGPNSTR